MAVSRIAVVDGLRTPFVKSWSSLNGFDAVALSTHVTRELLCRTELPADQLDQVVWGTVIAVPRSPNIAREVALNLGLYNVPGVTVSRACATGFQAIASAAEKIAMGHAEIVVAGGVDVTSDAPVPHKKEVIDQLRKMQRQAPLAQARNLMQLKLKDFFPQPPALTERYTGKTMGEHAEDMAKYFGISREEQDHFSIESHRKANQATVSGLLDVQKAPVIKGTSFIADDNIIRPEMNPEKLKKLRPSFDKHNGTITAASSSALTDGAAAVLLMSEEKAAELGLTPLGFLRGYAFSAHDPRENMLLGNVYATPTALDRSGIGFEDLDLVEIHEAFAAQVLANLRCFESAEFFKEKLNRASALGALDHQKLNIWGGSLAYGHPFAATGIRITLNLLHGLRHQDGQFALGTACAAGGLGSAMIFERA